MLKQIKRIVYNYFSGIPISNTANYLQLIMHCYMKLPIVFNHR